MSTVSYRPMLSSDPMHKPVITHVLLSSFQFRVVLSRRAWWPSDGIVMIFLQWYKLHLCRERFTARR